MAETGFVTQTEYQKHIRGEWRTIHNLWPHIRNYVPAHGYSRAEIDAMFEGYSGTGKALIDAANVGGLTEGSIPFADATGFLTEDNANLFWDATKANLGIGTNTFGADMEHGIQIATGVAPTGGIADTFAFYSKDVGGVAGKAGPHFRTEDNIVIALNQSLLTTDNVEFAALTLVNTVNEFSIDGTLGGDSDSAVPTEKAVKLYVDTQIGGVNEFIELTDTPANYVGSAGKFVKVNVAPDGLEFANLVKADITDTPWAWGDVSKVGSDLTDLATRQHAGLTDVTSDQHHAQVHDLDSHSDLNAGAPNDQDVLTWDDGTSKWIAQAAAGAATFLDLTDTPGAYATHSLETLRVNFAEDAIEFYVQTDQYVKVDGGAASGYLGVAAGDGVLRTGANITVADGGNFITLDTVQNIGTGDSPTFAGVTLGNEGLHILDTNASHDLIIKAGSDLTADRIFTLMTGDAAKTLTLLGDSTIDNWFDQSVKQVGTPVFAGLTITDIFVEDHGADHNLFLGHLAGSSIAGGGQYNLFIGEDSGLDITTGDRNILIGYEAGKEANTTAYDNICIGYQAGLGVDGNIYTRNVFIGSESGKAATTAHRNTGVGNYSLRALTSGYYNVAVGWYAGISLLGGHSNTFLGQSAGYHTTTGYSNVAIGNGALHGAAASTAFRNVAIGNNAGYDTISGASYNVFIGTSAGYFNENGTQNTFIGANAGLGVDGQVNSLNTFIGRDAGKNITTGGSNVVIGALTAAALTSGSNNVFIGYHAGHALTTQGNNTFVGAYAGESITGAGNTAYGHYALRSGTGAGAYNTAVGVQCLTNASAQSFNTAVGFGAGLFQNTGSSNVYIGYQAGYTDDSTGNVAIGRQAGYNMKAGSNYNISIGYSACQGNIANTHTHNVCIGGYRTGYILDAGNYNIMMGSYCGDAITSGSNNVLIGYKAGSSLTTHDGCVMIGYSAGENATASNTLYIANSNTVTPLIYGEFPNALLRIQTTDFEVIGTSKLGDGGTTDYTEVKADGEINLHGTARVINGQWIDAQAIKAPQTNPAELISFGVLETPSYQFADAIEANQENVTFNMRLPYRMDMGVAPFLAIGWSAVGVSPGNCRWQLEYLYTKLNDNTALGPQDTVLVTSAASATTNGLVVVALPAMEVPEGTDLCVHCRVTRLSADVLDTISDTVEMHGVCLSFTIDRLGLAT